MSVETTTDADARLLLSCGRVVRPMELRQDRISFRLAPGEQPRRLLSRAARPCDIVGPFLDNRRRLGLKVSKLVLWQGLEESTATADALAMDGWHAAEDGLRWTDGAAALDLPPAGELGSVIDVHVAATLRYPLAAPDERSAA